MKYFLIFLFAFPFLLHSQIKAEVKGKVMDASTKEVLSDVKIIFFSSSKGTNNTFTTDESGTFQIRISTQKNEKIYLTVSKEGYNDYKTVKRVTKDGQIIEVVCYLNPNRP